MSDKKIKTTGRYENPEIKEFYQAEISDHTVTIRFGKIGTIGHCSSREFASAKEAEKFVVLRIRKKFEAGFKPV